MRQFLIKISAITIPFIVLLLVLNYAFSKSYWWTVYYTEQEKFSHVPQNIQLANVGSSHGVYAFDYSDFPEYTAFNMAVCWQHHGYNYHVLKQYIDYFSENAVMLIPISYFDITRIDEEPLYKYYKILEKKNFPDWNIKGYFLFKVFPFFSTKEPWKKILINELNSVLAAHERTIVTEQSVTTDAKVMYEIFTKDNGAEKGEEGFLYNIEAVSKIIDLCHEHSIIPVLVSTPQTDKLNDLHEEADFFSKFYRFTDVLKEKYPGLIYLDYSQTSEYSSDYSLFFDSTHLNNKGAKKFTAQIVQDLKKAGLLQ